MLSKIRQMQLALGIEEAQMLLMARRCAGDGTLLSVDHLMSVDQFELLQELELLERQELELAAV